MTKWLLGLSLMVWSSLVLAHSPTKMNFLWNEEEQVLKIEVVHDSKYTTKHYVDEYIVFVNGKEILKKERDAQDNNDGSFYKIDSKAFKKGDKIEVKASCNIWGSLKQEFIVP